ncbi:S-adenosylmethionine synthase [Roseibium aquae]|uniref:S-adenosylmethionine synthase n=1 Tax=Roseibium aquae TaxID=1323746 RepID=A0A916WXF6_9HYPH|nr:methionine adenosyltransferase domain-containing protein [Roseibium aquae]GGB38109.1 S-adenosylmethionine synthase [Roseibium aquae]
MRDFVLSSQAVTSAHPDKMSDQVCDAMVDAFLTAPAPAACVAECALASGIVFLSLRYGGPLSFDPAALARQVIAKEGYGGETGGSQPTVMLDLTEMPELVGLPERVISLADRMTTAFGYACDHTPERMPLPIRDAHRVCMAIEDAIRDRRLMGIARDAQAQIAVRFAGRRPVDVTGIAVGVFAPGHSKPDALEEMIRAEAIKPALAGSECPITTATRISVTSVDSPGGPSVHAGLTGRKSSADGYGGFCRETSSAFSGKHPARIDRVAAYAARQAAVSVVAAGLARECEVQLSYVPGDSEAASLEVDCFETALLPESEISETLRQRIDFSIGGIIERLNLWALPRARGGQFYAPLARRSHFGRTDMDLPWDQPIPLSGSVGY